MGAYKVLLADDEEEVIQAIMKKIDWESLGFTVVGSAYNGVKALELAEECQPDVAITDIKMPYMDGLELSRNLKKEFPNIKILIFTGFDEFEYAKEAIHLEVEEYILKPIDSAKLTEIFMRLKTSLDQELAEKRNVEKMQKYYDDSLPLLQSNFYSTLIEGRISENDLPKFLSDYQITLSGPVYCCVVIHTSAGQIPKDMSPVLLSMAVQKQAEERFLDKWRAVFFMYLGNTIMLAQMNNENEVTDLTDECDRFCRSVQWLIGAVTTMGIGIPCRKLTDLQQSYSGAREAVSYRVLYGPSKGINIREIAPQEAGDVKIAGDSEIGDLLKKVRLDSAEAVSEAVDHYVDHVLVKATTLQSYHLSSMELVSALYRFAANNEIDIESLTEGPDSLYAGISEMEPEMLRNRLKKVCGGMREWLLTARSNTTKSFVTSAREFVQDHYSDPNLSLDYICGTLGVSSSYFSSVFKKETGKAFISYLTDFRMEKAAQMLLETEDKNYIVAKKTGYTDPNYFSYVFKKQFGVSPSNYRSEHLKGEG